MSEISDDGDADDGERYSPAEIGEALDGLSDAERAELVTAAKWFSDRCGLPAQELLNEAIARALEGRRRCRIGTTVVEFLAGVMKSFASQEIESRGKGHRPVLVDRFGPETIAEPVVDAPSPEHEALSRIEDRRVLAEIEEVIANDEALQLPVEGLCDGTESEELQELLGVDAKGLAAARKKLKRRLESRFPERMAS